MQEILDGRRTKKTRRNFAFSGLLTCGHCGCAMVAEIKKGRYVYYHCTGFRGKCPEQYTREEVLEQKFTDLLRSISFSAPVLDWVGQILGENHQDERKLHQDAIAKLQQEHRRTGDRLDAMYVDKLDGRIDNDFFDRKAAEFRAEQCRLMSDVAMHQEASERYTAQGARIADMAHRAAAMFEQQPAAEKRKLLDFVVSTCRWKGGELEPVYRQPFDMLAAGDTRKPMQEVDRAQSVGT